jgi:hypothetical protein
VTHRYAAGTVQSPYAAVVMKRDTSLDWNTIMMSFNWFDVRDLGRGGSAPGQAELDLAGRILEHVLGDCSQGVDPVDLPPGEETDALPRVTALFQNAPNPFNPATTIRFDLAVESEVRLRIFDVAGHLVRTLVHGSLPRQRHEVPWNGLDEQGQRVGSGIYFYRLEAGDFRATRKLVVLK